MNDAELLTRLKWNLEIDTTFMDEEARIAKDQELSFYLSSAREYITRFGIDLTESEGDKQLVVMYASGLYNARRAPSSYSDVAKMLRKNLNNRLFEQNNTDGNPSAVMKPDEPVSDPQTEDPEDDDA